MRRADRYTLVVSHIERNVCGTNQLGVVTMKHRTRAVFLVLLATAAAAPAQQSSRMVSAGLFKNGIASIAREYTVPGPGHYTFDALGSPVHGTLWIESEAPVVARSGEELVDAEPDQAAAAGLQDALVGKEVEIGLRLEGSSRFTGKLLSAPGGGAQEPRVFNSNGEVFSPSAASSSMMVIESGGRRNYIARDLVAWVRALEPAGVVKHTKPVVVFDVGEGAPNPTVIRARYLVQGMAWAPSYRIDLTDGKTLSVGQSAVIRNDLEDLDQVDLELISGFPNVEFLRAVSPFASNVTWSDFLSRLQQPAANVSAFGGQSNVASNIGQLFTNSVAGMGDMPQASIALEDGADIYYHPVGKQSLRRGEAQLLTTGTASAEYERIVEWRVNRSVRENVNSGLAQEDIWDAVRFKNPLPFPMTTGPAMVEAKGRFLGSKTIFWAAPGDETVAYISKALSVRAGYEEVEVSRNEVTALNQHLYETVVKGTLRIQNPRTEAVTMLIREDFSGALLRADGDPVSTVGSAGPGQRNPSTKLKWKTTLDAGQERSLVLEYKFITE